jgi:uncharacterized coiled-coil protein SlyX
MSDDAFTDFEARLAELKKQIGAVERALRDLYGEVAHERKVAAETAALAGHGR